MFPWWRCEVDYLSQNFEEVQNIEMRSSPNSQKSGFQLECWYWTWFSYFKCILWGFTNHDNRIADLKVARNGSHVKYTSAWDRALAKSCCKKNANDKVRARGFSQCLNFIIPSLSFSQAVTCYLLFQQQVGRRGPSPTLTRCRRREKGLDNKLKKWK